MSFKLSHDILLAVTTSSTTISNLPDDGSIEAGIEAALKNLVIKLVDTEIVDLSFITDSQVTYDIGDYFVTIFQPDGTYGDVLVYVDVFAIGDNNHPDTSKHYFAGQYDLCNYLPTAGN